MPTYGYRCRSCGHEFEVLQRMSDPPLKTCPKCAGELAKKVYSAGIIYKGSGYYTTDYKGKTAETSSAKSSTSDSGSESSSSNGSSKASEGGGESKPAGEGKAESKASKSDSST
jgi:putative FmdB family regulatory protein